MTPSETSLENARQLKTLRWVVLGISCLFVGVLWNGYFNLFLNRGTFLAAILGLLLALIAWGVGKFVGSSEGGIRTHTPLFVLMLILSAVGVFNALMINLEGHRIFQEAIDSALLRFRELGPVASEVLADDPEIVKKRERIAGLRLVLQQEIEHPENCGAGPAARKIMGQVEKELSGFTILSSPQGTCAEAQQIAKAYVEQIDKLEAQYLQKAGYPARIEAREKALTAAAEGGTQLRQLAKDIDNGANLLTTARPRLEDLSATYETYALALSQYPAGKGLQSTLDLTSVRNLGEWSQVINLIASRLDKLQTYVYMFLAGFFDWLLVHLFVLIRRLRKGIQPAKIEAVATVTNPF